jgi:hypothetical protein
VLKTLLERRLIKVLGRKQVIGRPILYGSSREFLQYFGLRDLTDLPRPDEMEPPPELPFEDLEGELSGQLTESDEALVLAEGVLGDGNGQTQGA